jgi:ADP-heptose:LPS heptosyltransferase
MNILIIRLHDLQILMASIPLVKAIKAKYPDANIDFVSSQQYLPYLNSISEINNTFMVHGDITPIVLQLLKQKYSHTIDLQCNSRSRFITSYLGQQYNAVLIKYRYPQNFWVSLFNKKVWQVPNLSTKFIDCTKDLNLGKNNLQWYYPTLPEDELKKNDLPTSHSVGYYCIDIIGLKNQIENVQQTIAQINFPVILLGTQHEFAMAEDLKQADQFKIYNACGKYTTAEQVNMLRKAKLLIGHNRDVISLAVASKIKILDTNPLPIGYADIEPYCFGGASTQYNWHNVAQLADAIKIGLKA